MRSFCICLCMAALFFHCGDLTVEGDAPVRRTLGRVVQALEDRDMQMLRDLTARDSELVVVGPDSGQTAIGWEAVQILLTAFFNAPAEMILLVRDQRVRLLADLEAACVFQRVDCHLEAADGEIRSRSLRCTVVLERKLKSWLVVLIHLSPEDGC